MDEKTLRIIAIVVGGFTIAVSANVVSEALYSHTKLGVDKKAALIASAIGLGSAFLLMKYAHKKAS